MISLGPVWKWRKASALQRRTAHKHFFGQHLDIKVFLHVFLDRRDNAFFFGLLHGNRIFTARAKGQEVANFQDKFSAIHF